jgi:hypothetical protein
MQLFIEVEKFANNPKALTNVLYYMRRHGCHVPYRSPEIEAITCKTPSAALRQTNLVSPEGVSEAAERVFLKNPVLGIRYLRKIRRERFQNDDTQRRFWKKIVKKADLAYQWAQAFQKRLSEEEEVVFLESMHRMKEYAFFIIKGRFPEKVHNMILLKSYESHNEWEKRALNEYIKYAESKTNQMVPWETT